MSEDDFDFLQYLMDKVSLYLARAEKADSPRKEVEYLLASEVLAISLQFSFESDEMERESAFWHTLTEEQHRQMVMAKDTLLGII